jgi:hypothetical protein
MPIAMCLKVFLRFSGPLGAHPESARFVSGKNNRVGQVLVTLARRRDGD